MEIKLLIEGGLWFLHWSCSSLSQNRLSIHLFLHQNINIQHTSHLFHWIRWWVDCLLHIYLEMKSGFLNCALFLQFRPLSTSLKCLIHLLLFTPILYWICIIVSQFWPYIYCMSQLLDGICSSVSAQYTVHLARLPTCCRLAGSQCETDPCATTSVLLWLSRDKRVVPPTTLRSYSCWWATVYGSTVPVQWMHASTCREREGSTAGGGSRYIYLTTPATFCGQVNTIRTCRSSFESSSSHVKLKILHAAS